MELELIVDRLTCFQYASVLFFVTHPKIGAEYLRRGSADEEAFVLSPASLHECVIDDDIVPGRVFDKKHNIGETVKKLLHRPWLFINQAIVHKYDGSVFIKLCKKSSLS